MGYIRGRFRGEGATIFCGKSGSSRLLRAKREEPGLLPELGDDRVGPSHQGEERGSWAAGVLLAVRAGDCSGLGPVGLSFFFPLLFPFSETLTAFKL